MTSANVNTKQKLSRIWNEFLTFLALLFLVAYSLPALKPDLSAESLAIINLSQWIIWSSFVLDLIIGVVKSDNKKRYLITHPLEVITVLLPFLRPLRVLRVISLGGLVIQKVAVGRQLAVALKVFMTSILLAYIAAVQITLVERTVESSNIKSFSDGLWWAVTTVTTVGYGDRYPVTSQGRAMAVGLMLVGISLMGVITASVAAWFVQMSSTESDEQ